MSHSLTIAITAGTESKALVLDHDILELLVSPTSDPATAAKDWLKMQIRQGVTNKLYESEIDQYVATHVTEAE